MTLFSSVVGLLAFALCGRCEEGRAVLEALDAASRAAASASRTSGGK